MLSGLKSFICGHMINVFGTDCILGKRGWDFYLTDVIHDDVVNLSSQESHDWTLHYISCLVNPDSQVLS